MNFRFLLLAAVFLVTGCSGLFEEFPEFEARDVGDNVEVDVEDDIGEPPEFDLALDVGPPAEVLAGEEFDLVLSLVDEGGQALDMEGVEVQIRVSEGEFAAGGDVVSASSNESGRVVFSLLIDEARTGLILTATSDHESFSQASLSTESFDVIGPELQAELSVIFGSAGTIADGDEEATITIELFDVDGNGIGGIIPEFSASGEGNIYKACSETNDNGAATCQMTSTVAEEKILEITEPVQVIGDTIEFLLPCDDSPSPFGGGEGNADNPYRICTPAHLNEIQDTTNALNGTFVLARDLDMAQVNDFNIIGDNANPFTGKFDGRGNRIRNLKIDRPDQDFVGIFGAVSEGAVVENVVLEAIDITGNDFVGSLAGSNAGSIIRCSATTGRVAGNGSSQNLEGGVGGLAGFNNSTGSITDSDVDVNVLGQERNIGGLVGRNNGEITGSHVTGSVDAGVPGVGENVGGVVGYNEGPISDSSSAAGVRGRNLIGGFVGSNFEGGAILGSSASGDVGFHGATVDDGNQIGGFAGRNAEDITGSHATGKVEGKDIVGGFIGTNSEGDIDSCFATGAVSAEKDTVGGLVGFNGGVTVSESFAIGEVAGIGSVGGLIGSNLGIVEDSFALGAVTGFRRVGGLIGSLAHFESVGPTEVNRSYASGAVIFRSSAAQDGERVGLGGLIGISRSSIISDSYATGSVDAAESDPSGGLVGVVINSDISNSYSAGLVEAGSLSGGSFGSLDADSTITDCYWDNETSGTGTGVANGSQDGVIGLSTDDFESTDNFATTWDFGEIWIIDEAPDGQQRPVLRSQE